MKLRLLINRIKRNSTGVFYVGTGLFKTFVQTITSFIILRWIAPEDLGQWQSFTVFVGYTSILTLGVTSGLNRELPYYLGKGNVDLAMERLKTAAAFTTSLSFFLTIVVCLVSIASYVFHWLNMNDSIMLFAAFSITAITIQTNLLGATYRSSQSFKQLGNIQLIVSVLHFVFLPVVYYFNIWGYIVYQSLMVIWLFWGYWHFRPYRIKSSFDKSHFIELVKIGMPMYIWNYLSQMLRTIPRVILVIFGSPLLVGIYSPAESINKSVLNLPNYINRYLFPKMSFNYGKSDNKSHIIQSTFRSASLLFMVMLMIAIVLALVMPYVFEHFFPKYKDAIVCVQIVLFSGVFYSVNALMHNTLNSLKIFEHFKIIIVLKFISLTLTVFLVNLLIQDILISVAIGATLSEFVNLLNYCYFLNKINKS